MSAPGEWPPFCHEEAGRLAGSASPSTGKRYGLQRVCRIFGLARSTAYYHKARDAVPPEQRPVAKKRGPVGAATDADLVGHIRRVLAESPFTGEGYRKVWARLRHQGVRTAAERVRRLMREHHLQAPRKGGNAHGPKAHDGTITTEKPDEMWGTDMTTTVTTGEGLAHVFVAVDHCTCECVGLHAAKCGNRFEALEPLRQGVREHFGRFEAKAAEGLTIRHVWRQLEFPVDDHYFSRTHQSFVTRSRLEPGGPSWPAPRGSSARSTPRSRSDGPAGRSPPPSSSRP